MTIIDTLITDRAQSDVDRAAELAAKGLSGMTAAERTEYLSGMKGSYNAADLNRVREAMEYVAGRVREYGYTVTLSSMTSFTRSDIPAPAQLQVYLNNLKTLRGILAVLPTTPAVPGDMEGLTFGEANDIEKILWDIEEILIKASAAFRHCNAAVCGMGGLIR